MPTLPWIQTRQVTDRAFVNAKRSEIDLGESQAIALAVELNAARLLIDERLGKTVAIRFGLEVTGVLGVLIAAKQRPLIPTVKRLYRSVNRVIEQTGFWVGEELYVEVLQAVEEL